MDKVERVLIVGAGLAGLALAIALRHRGISAALVERASEGSAGGAGLYLIGAATRALQLLGVADEAARDGCVIRAQTLFDHRAKRLAEVDVEVFWKGCGPCLGVARGALHQLLTQQATGLHLRRGVTVHALRQREDHVTVQMSDGNCETYDLVVGADGIRSCVRHLAFDEADPTSRGQLGWRFIVRRPPGVDGWAAFLGPESAFLMVPISNELAYCYADKSSARSMLDPAQGSIKDLQETFASFAGPVREVLASADSIGRVHLSAIEEVSRHCYGRGRVVLIGDAAHAMSPNMACGAALAFEDALVLAEIVAHARGVSEVVSEFARRRSVRVDWVRQQTHRRDRMRSLPPVVRDIVLRLRFGRLYKDNYRPLLENP